MSHLVLAMAFLAFASLVHAQKVESLGTIDHALTPSILTFNNTARQATCDRTDITCWCLKAVQYTNAVRRQRGVSNILKVGPENQLENAVKYAERLARMGSLAHQDFRVANREIGCGRALGGENVALNFETGDIAKACVDQWVSSKGHLENILRDWFLEVVVGFAFDRNGGVFCVQTFAVTDPGNGSPADGGCEPVGGSLPSADMSDPEPEPEQEQAEVESGEVSPPSLPSSPSDGAVSKYGRRACQCVKFGRRCSESLAERTGNVCTARAQRGMQTKQCQQVCCEHCRGDSRARECRNRAVRGICRGL